MANLEKRHTISALQLALLVAATGIGVNMVAASRKMAELAGVHEWLAFIIGAGLFWGAATIIIRVGNYFPLQDIVSYMPQLWGKAIGNAIVAWYIGIFVIGLIMDLADFSKIIAFFLFDRTPIQILALGMLIVCTHCALQDFGTVLRVMQLVFLFTIPVSYVLFSMSGLVVMPDNLLPLWPRNVAGVLAGSLYSWNYYTGYEIIALFLPLVERRNFRISTAVAASFGCMTFFFLTIALITIGVLSAANAREISYPTIEVVRVVELPGTFVERLENYVLIIWIPTIFSTMTMLLFIAGQALKELAGHADHRPWILAVVPFTYFIFCIMNEMKSAVEWGEYLRLFMGLVFSFGIMPVSLAMAWWKSRRQKLCQPSSQQ